ncbi:MAG: hypothetical protein ACLTNE_07385 [Intestinimonas butyriciproducens]|uniref:hypothetical protein n=1 Tax=Intestinimonas butyriciproducens TaxID=1297617 RepID=UPI00399522A9|nr:hypothetical protein [Clostridiales bacterium]
MEQQATNKNLKPCKACGKEMAKSAKACPHCGAKNKKPIFTKVWFWVLVVLALVIFFISSLEEVTETSAIVNGESVTSTELLEEHENNRIAFANEYNGSTVTVTSKVEEVLPHGTFNGRAHGAVIKLYGSWWVEVSDSTAAFLSPDDEVTINGTLQDVWNDYFWITNAKVVK